MKTIFFAATLIFVGISNGYAQVCGGGTRSYKIFVQNGLRAENVRYEVYAIVPINHKGDLDGLAAYLYETFLPFNTRNLARFWIHEPLKIDRGLAEKFLKTYKADCYQKEPDEAYFRDNKQSGEVPYGSVSFKTLELYDRPLLLKIIADNYKPVYLLGNHFGGCSITYSVLLDDYQSNGD